jgi:hypothetical protein
MINGDKEQFTEQWYWPIQGLVRRTEHMYWKMPNSCVVPYFPRPVWHTYAALNLIALDATFTANPR